MGNMERGGLSKNRERQGSSLLHLKKINLFTLIGGSLLYNIVVVFAVH